MNDAWFDNADDMDDITRAIIMEWSADGLSPLPEDIARVRFLLEQTCGKNLTPDRVHIELQKSFAETRKDEDLFEFIDDDNPGSVLAAMKRAKGGPLGLSDIRDRNDALDHERLTAQKSAKGVFWARMLNKVRSLWNR